MSVDVAALSEGFAARVTCIRSFAGMSSLMGLEVAELREALATAGLAALERLVASVCSGVNVQVGFLEKLFGAARDVTIVALP